MVVVLVRLIFLLVVLVVVELVLVVLVLQMVYSLGIMPQQLTLTVKAT
jgi:hypothetical protein